MSKRVLSIALLLAALLAAADGCVFKRSCRKCGCFKDTKCSDCGMDSSWRRARLDAPSASCCETAHCEKPCPPPTKSPTRSPMTSRPSTPPTLFPSRSPTTSQPTHSPSIPPTLSPTSSSPTTSPSYAPSAAPTPHPCDDNSHGCTNATLGGVCYRDGNGWRCACLQGFWCQAGCNRVREAHNCLPVTQRPSVPPSGSPTAAPSVPPSLSPSSSPTATPTRSPSTPPTVSPSAGPTFYTARAHFKMANPPTQAPAVFRLQVPHWSGSVGSALSTSAGVGAATALSASAALSGSRLSLFAGAQCDGSDSSTLSLTLNPLKLRIGDDAEAGCVAGNLGIVAGVIVLQLLCTIAVHLASSVEQLHRAETWISAQGMVRAPGLSVLAALFLFQGTMVCSARSVMFYRFSTTGVVLGSVGLLWCFSVPLYLRYVLRNVGKKAEYRYDTQAKGCWLYIMGSHDWLATADDVVCRYGVAFRRFNDRHPSFLVCDTVLSIVVGLTAAADPGQGTLCGIRAVTVALAVAMYALAVARCRPFSQPRVNHLEVVSQSLFSVSLLIVGLAEFTLSVRLLAVGSALTQVSLVILSVRSVTDMLALVGSFRTQRNARLLHDRCEELLPVTDVAAVEAAEAKQLLQSVLGRPTGAREQAAAVESLQARDGASADASGSLARYKDFVFAKLGVESVRDKKGCGWHAEPSLELTLLNKTTPTLFSPDPDTLTLPDSVHTALRTNGTGCTLWTRVGGPLCPSRRMSQSAPPSLCAEQEQSCREPSGSQDSPSGPAAMFDSNPGSFDLGGRAAGFAAQEPRRPPATYRGLRTLHSPAARDGLLPGLVVRPLGKSRSSLHWKDKQGGKAPSVKSCSTHKDSGQSVVAPPSVRSGDVTPAPSTPLCYFRPLPAARHPLAQAPLTPGLGAHGGFSNQGSTVTASDFELRDLQLLGSSPRPSPRCPDL